MTARDKVTVIQPHLPEANRHNSNQVLVELLDSFLQSINLEDTAFWYYTPMALLFSGHHKARVTIYDCMDELAAFKFAPAELKNLEEELMSKADVVFTGGRSLYNAKKDRHANIHPFPSSIDKNHFSQARNMATVTPLDQANIPHPRIGFFGVIDERFDIELLDNVATEKPDWHFVVIGPVVKIDPASLPNKHNIHYLGIKSYTDLPQYLGGWDIAMIPFQINESTKFISPTKTPEYLTAGVPVISTPIEDVIEPYGNGKHVHIVSCAQEFIMAGEEILTDGRSDAWLSGVDAFLATNSWDNTLTNMLSRIKETMLHINNN